MKSTIDSLRAALVGVFWLLAAIIGCIALMPLWMFLCLYVAIPGRIPKFDLILDPTMGLLSAATGWVARCIKGWRRCGNLQMSAMLIRLDDGPKDHESLDEEEVE